MSPVRARSPALKRTTAVASMRRPLVFPLSVREAPAGMNGTSTADLLAANLLFPFVLAFSLGVVAKRFGSNLSLPKDVYDGLSTYLLLAIGLMVRRCCCRPAIPRFVGGSTLGLRRRRSSRWWSRKSTVAPSSRSSERRGSGPSPPPRWSIRMGVRGPPFRRHRGGPGECLRHHCGAADHQPGGPGHYPTWCREEALEMR